MCIYNKHQNINHMPITKILWPKAFIQSKNTHPFLSKNVTTLGMRSSAFGSVLCPAAPLCAMPRWYALRAFKHFCGKRTKVYLDLGFPFSMLCTRLLGATHCIPVEHGTGLRSGTHRGTVRYDSLWHALDLIWKWSAASRFQTPSVWVRFALGVFKCSSGTLWYRKGTSIRQAPVFRHLGTFRKSPWKFIIWMTDLYNYTACCWFPTSNNILILPSQFWQIRFESY